MIPQPGIFCNTGRTELQPVFWRNREIGRIHGTTFHQWRLPSQIIHHPTRSIAFDVGMFAYIEQHATHAEIELRETGSGPSTARYRVPLATIRAHGYTFDHGHGRQIALALTYWERVDVAKQPTLFDLMGVGAA